MYVWAGGASDYSGGALKPFERVSAAQQYVALDVHPEGKYHVHDKR